jgi:hypothetical protein
MFNLTLRSPKTGHPNLFGSFSSRSVRTLLSLMCAGGTSLSLRAQGNLLKNAGFEESGSPGVSANWSMHAESPHPATLSEKGAHGGQRCLAVPPHSAVEQQVEHVAAGAYLARGWVKSAAEQRVTLMLANPARPWAAYTLVEAKVPKDEWTQIEAFCSVDLDGSLTLTVGGMSKDFRAYHGPEAEMLSPILIDDFELIRSEPKDAPGVRFWDARSALKAFALPPDERLVKPGGESAFVQTPIFQARQVAGTVRGSDGALLIYGEQGGAWKERGTIVPTPGLKNAKVTLVNSAGRTGLRVASENEAASYTAWISVKGLVTIEPNNARRFRLENTRISYGILPSFVGSDICYAPRKIAGASTVVIPSTQWFVGLAEGRDSMFVAVWDSPSQGISLGFSGEGGQRVIDSLSIDTSTGGFSFSLVEHPGLWSEEALKEDYLGDYTALDWQRPFPARWMAQFFVSPGGKRSFHDPFNDYSFPIASAKTRMWGVWFEDWNHYPFYFDGTNTMAHFEKSFVPKGNALFYFLEPAMADLYSPCEIVQQALGADKAAALFDFDANVLRKLKYSTPPLFMYDRPVCATTTRLSKIKQEEKPTVGVDLATHLYEFIREIRGRVDQYTAFFADLKSYLDAEKAAHPETRSYVAPLEGLVAEAQSRAKKVYDTPLPTVQEKIDGMKKLLAEGKGDGFNCGNLDVRSPAGEQDDLCRRYNRLTLYLMQRAALDCGGSPEDAVIAKQIWDRSRAVLRQPTRWEPRRTLYFFEP